MKIFQWVKKAAAWFGVGRNNTSVPVPTPTVKAVADAVIQQARADIAVHVTRLTNAEITVAQLEPLMQDAIKHGIVANTALAHGGYENLTPEILARAEKRVLAQHDFLRNRVEVIAANVSATGALQPRDAGDLLSYTNAFRSVYENERVEAQKSIGHEEAQRILAAVDSCAGCIEAAGKWMPIDDILPIGGAECGDRCHCVIITRKARSDESK